MANEDLVKRLERDASWLDGWRKAFRAGTSPDPQAVMPEIVADVREATEAIRTAIAAMEPFASWLSHISATGSRKLADNEWPEISGVPNMDQLRALKSALSSLRALAGEK